MNSLDFILWIAEIVVLSAIIFAVKLPLLIKPHPVLRSIILVVEFLLSPVAALLSIAIVSPFSYRFGDSFAYII